MRSRSGSVSILVVTVGVAVTVTVVVAVSLAVGFVGAGARPASAQEADRAPGEPCVAGATLPAPGQTVSGPSPVGRCEPSTSRRALDLGIWVVTVASVVAVVGLGVVLARRDRRVAGLAGDPPADSAPNRTSTDGA